MTIANDMASRGRASPADGSRSLRELAVTDSRVAIMGASRLCDLIINWNASAGMAGVWERGRSERRRASSWRGRTHVGREELDVETALPHFVPECLPGACLDSEQMDPSSLRALPWMRSGGQPFHSNVGRGRRVAGAGVGCVSIRSVRPETSQSIRVAVLAVAEQQPTMRNSSLHQRRA
jgi:hypothetical protein